jgi:hypothetical protein
MKKWGIEGNVISTAVLGFALIAPWTCRAGWAGKSWLEAALVAFRH